MGTVLAGVADLLCADQQRFAAVQKRVLADGIERNFFPDLSPDETKIVSLLQQTNDLQLNILSVKTGIPIGQLTALLFQMEMKGVVKPLAGGMYHLFF